MRIERAKGVVDLTHATHWPLISDTFHPDPHPLFFSITPLTFSRSVMLDTHTRFVCICQVKSDDELLDTRLPYLDTYLQDPLREATGYVSLWFIASPEPAGHGPLSYDARLREG